MNIFDHSIKGEIVARMALASGHLHISKPMPGNSIQHVNYTAHQLYLRFRMLKFFMALCLVTPPCAIHTTDRITSGRCAKHGPNTPTIWNWTFWWSSPMRGWDNCNLAIQMRPKSAQPRNVDLIGRCTSILDLSSQIHRHRLNRKHIKWRGMWCGRWHFPRTLFLNISFAFIPF